MEGKCFVVLPGGTTGRTPARPQPYQREVLLALEQGALDRVVFVPPTQTGKSAALADMRLASQGAACALMRLGAAAKALEPEILRQLRLLAEMADSARLSAEEFNAAMARPPAATVDPNPKRKRAQWKQDPRQRTWGR